MSEADAESHPIEVCAVADVAPGAARGFAVDAASGERVALIVVRWDDAVHVYRNRCPHAGSPLDWRPDVFFDAAGEHLMCSTHGALFRPADGECVAGPCAGDRLPRVDAAVRDEKVRVRLD